MTMDGEHGFANSQRVARKGNNTGTPHSSKPCHSIKRRPDPSHSVARVHDGVG